MEFIKDLIITEFKWFYLRIVILPCLTLATLYLVYIILLKFGKISSNFVIERKVALLKSVIISVFLFNFYWCFLIYKNGIFIFNWSSFEYTRGNIYFMLLPVLTSYFILGFIYFKTQKNIKKLF
jgi:hypothetical protein